MKLLLDENVPLASFRLLSNAGHDVTRIILASRVIDDDEIIDRATRERQTIMTFDRDFGHLVFKQGRLAPYGVVFLRLGRYAPTEPAERILDLLRSGENRLLGYFTTITRARIRQRRLYRTPEN